MSDDFDDIIAGIEFDRRSMAIAEQRAAMEARLQLLEAEAAALRATLVSIDQTREERDCKILPEHFRREGEDIMFCAPAEERKKMDMLLHQIHYVACVRSMNKFIANEFIGEEGDDDYIAPDEWVEQEGETIDLPTTHTVRATLFNDMLDENQVRCWRRLFAYCADAFDDGGSNRAELDALIARLDELV